ncbi:CapA family protein [Nakamurella sp.]|uniref:CapA family protein n=1 Tax=Nakamurella sp. TaxID=1869182 RepID=UPI00378462AD
MGSGRRAWIAVLAAAALVCTACASGRLAATSPGPAPVGVNSTTPTSTAAVAPLTEPLRPPGSTRVTVPAPTAATTGARNPDSPPSPVPEPAPASSAEPTPEPTPPADPTPSADHLVGEPGPGVGNNPCPGIRCVTLALTGDVLLHPELVAQARADGRDTGDGTDGLDFFPMLAAQQAYVAGADIGICHLETPLAPAGGPFSGYPSFSVPPQVLPALVRSGYDACSTASNHTFDRGTDGIDRTLDDLDAAGLLHDGSYRTEADSRRPVIINTPNGRVGLISVAYDFNGLTLDEPWQAGTIDTGAILAKAHAARAAGADLVVVAMHGGEEYDSTPNAQQKAAAKALLASPDVDLVYGHHAHVVQPMEKIDGKWAIYGLGNNIAAQGTEVTGTRDGLLVRVQFSQAADGTWSTSDVAWVASYQDLTSPFRWCALTSDHRCGPADAASLARTTATVNAWGAAADGAHRLD